MPTIAPAPAPAPATTGTRPGRPAWRQPAQLGLIGVAAVAYTGIVDPNHSHLFPLCPLKLVTGLDCPVCGSLRATHSLVHGHIGSAASHNLLFVLAAPFVVFAWATWLGSAAGWPVRRWHLPTRAWWTIAAVAGLFMVLRNLPAPPLHWLAST